MSESGIFVETTHELPPGKRVVIIPDLAEDEEQLPFEIHGVVVRSNEYNLDEHWDRTPGIAFHLEGMSEENFAKLRAFLESHGVKVRGT
jgi:Tfp pilus assembly protein PilZ